MLEDRPRQSNASRGALARAMVEIAQASSPEDTITLLRSQARSLVGADGIAIIRRDGRFCHYVEEDAIGSLWKGQKFPMSACVSGWAMLNKQTVVIEDVAADERIPQELYADTFVRSLAMAPVRQHDPVGAIGAYWAQRTQPTREQVEILEALANAAAAGLSKLEKTVDRANPASAASFKRPSSKDFRNDLAAVSAIPAVSLILDLALQLTGMGFAAVARVTEDRWITCQSLDRVAFGLKPGDELPIESTICNEIRGHRTPVVIDDVADDPIYREHHTPKIYGLKSYISFPIILSDGRFFGTLCAIDTRPAKVKNPLVMGTFQLFAELIGQHLDAGDRLRETQASLERERELAELREQFIAVLGHDLRNPIAALEAGTTRLLKEGWTSRSPVVLQLMKNSITRMSVLVSNVLDLTRARMGDGLQLEIRKAPLSETLSNVIEELRLSHPDRTIVALHAFHHTVDADHNRLAQLFSNLIANALTHGAKDQPVRIEGALEAGHLQVSVINAGDPIPSHQIDKLFMPFRRGSSSSQGLGLGLFIASQVAEAHGGTLSVTSDETETRFIFRMPHA